MSSRDRQNGAAVQDAVSAITSPNGVSVLEGKIFEGFTLGRGENPEQAVPVEVDTSKLDPKWAEAINGGPKFANGKVNQRSGSGDDMPFAETVKPKDKGSMGFAQQARPKGEVTLKEAAVKDPRPFVGCGK